jgi:hypothetical protein
MAKSAASTRTAVPTSTICYFDHEWPHFYGFDLLAECWRFRLISSLAITISLRFRCAATVGLRPLSLDVIAIDLRHLHRPEGDADLVLNHQVGESCAADQNQRHCINCVAHRLIV